MLYAEEVYTILGACFEVYKRMGCGFLEAVYQECLEIEACTEMADEHTAQLLNSLHGSGLRVGILDNFGHHPKLEYKRMVL